MPRPEGDLGPGEPEIMEFAAGLRLLREKAGRPGYRELARRAHFSATTLSEAAGGRRLPTLAVALAYVNACGGNGPEWEERWRRAALLTPPASPTGTDGDASETPYQGLAAYGPERAGWFFGREELVDDLLRRLARRRLLAVFGASGSGKSSLLRAGLVPAVLAGRVPAPDRQPGTDREPEPAHPTEPLAGSAPPVVLVTTPGPDPLGELAVRLARLTGVPAGALRADLAADPANLHLAVRQAVGGDEGGPELLLVVDQFEEIFTQCRDDHNRAGFVAALLAAVRAPRSRLRVVLGVRADFYGRCAESPDLPAALSGAQVLVGPMTPPQVRDAVVRPAERAGAMVEGALVSFSPNGESVASLSLDSTIRIWPATGGSATLLAAAGQGAATTRLTYTPDGRHLALLGGQELTGIQLWATGVATEPVTLHPLGPGPLGFAFAPDGEWVATVHSDGSVRTWSCDVCGSVDRLLAVAATRHVRPFSADERRAFLLDR